MKIQLKEAVQPLKKQVSFRIDTPTRDRFRELCKRYEYNQSFLIEQAIKEIITQIEKEQGLNHE